MEENQAKEDVVGTVGSVEVVRRWGDRSVILRRHMPNTAYVPGVLCTFTDAEAAALASMIRYALGIKT